MRPALRRLASLAVFGSQLLACTQWQPQATSPQRVIGAGPGNVRITRTDGRQMVLLRPRIVGDSLVGELPAEASHSQASTTALSEIESMAVRRPDPTRTSLLLTGLVATAVGFMAVLVNDTGYETGVAMQIGE
jgi:hypothetical protein